MKERVQQTRSHIPRNECEVGVSLMQRGIRSHRDGCEDTQDRLRLRIVTPLQVHIEQLEQQRERI